MEWRDVVGYEGIYEVSDTGEVRTKEGKTTYTERHGVRKWKQRVLKQKVGKDNSCRVALWKDGKDRTWLVHRIVAKAFIPRVEGKEYINHIDGSRLNNNVDNLEWCDHTENNNHAFDTDLMTSHTKIVLLHNGTKETHLFRSMAKASEFLGRNSGYVSGVLKKGKTEIDDYTIFIEAGKTI
ncbi:NUMOD4 motif-containing HNH endonuclease [Sporosarcina highlanderae]|uniref:NUMOD4 motif-containing HNH endonuclease n=1 Tax=Sporosarcina highlanderae TaxID=3035916 RepID=A0ABT8JYD3_9BACL|nr:NUMOD4 motif-containing HNH endonuclease [Sporosarcina highlanderae]MDN4609149.1 NUMOD4 motif-containing HNH endonuclease [Sporosarcina highlanderae]